jgi:hypothetical protein
LETQIHANRHHLKKTPEQKKQYECAGVSEQGSLKTQWRKRLGRRKVKAKNAGVTKASKAEKGGTVVPRSSLTKRMRSSKWEAIFSHGTASSVHCARTNQASQ